MSARKDTEVRAKRVQDRVSRKIKQLRGFGKPEDRRLVFDYERMRAANGIKEATRASELVTLGYLLQFTSNKDLRRLRQRDIVAFLADVRQRKYASPHYKKRIPNVGNLSDSVMDLHKLILRQFMTFAHHRRRGEYPECVAWMSIRKICGNRKVETKDLFTPDEIKGMIACAENPRDRLVVSLLAESGARVGEVSTIRIKDIALFRDLGGFSVTLRGKTGERTIPLCLCETDLKEWLNNYHPFKSDPDSPLFTRFSDRSVKTNLGGDGIHGVVTRIAKRAGVTRRVYPHLFRHTRATELARLGWNEVMLRQFFGWDKKSAMPAVYVHLAHDDLQDYYLRMYGKAPTETKETKTLSGPKPCPHCAARNPTGYVFCFNCNQPLNQQAEKRSEADNILNRIVQDPALREQFDQLLATAIRKDTKP